MGRQATGSIKALPSFCNHFIKVTPFLFNTMQILSALWFPPWPRIYS